MNEEEKDSGGVAVDSTLPALQGRELDAAVAERVMDDPCNCERTPDGSQWCRRHGTGKGIGAKAYSSDIRAAMDVVDRMRQLQCELEIASDRELWTVETWLRFERSYGKGKQLTARVAAETLAEAILSHRFSFDRRVCARARNGDSER